jgi:hypothetical protein
MAIPQIQLPVPVADIPKEIGRLREHLETLESEKKITQSLIDAVRSTCPHTRKRSWRDRVGDPCSECEHCGKGW